MDKFESMVKPGGLLLYDPNGITRRPEREDITIATVEGVKEASKLENKKTFNMIILGAFLKVHPIVKMANVHKGLEKSLPQRHHHLIPLNEKAITIGMDKVQIIQESNKIRAII